MLQTSHTVQLYTKICIADALKFDRLLLHVRADMLYEPHFTSCHLLQTTSFRNPYWFSNTLMSRVSSIDHGMNSELGLAIRTATSGWATSRSISWQRMVDASWDSTCSWSTRRSGTGSSTARSLWLMRPTTTSWQSAGFQVNSPLTRLVSTMETGSWRTTEEISATVPLRTEEDSGSVELRESTRTFTTSNGPECTAIIIWCTPKCGSSVHSWSRYFRHTAQTVIHSTLCACVRVVCATITSCEYWTHY